MKDSTRGVLWSALVFPGSGQIVLKHLKRGLLFVLFSLAGVIAMIVTVVRGTWTGMEHLALQGSDISISSMITVAIGSLIIAKTYILPPMLFCWLFSVIDAWRLGRLSK